MEGGPLVISQDGGVVDAVMRIAAAAGVDVECTSDPGSRAAWRRAGTVLIDAALVQGALAAGLPRRDRVVVVAAAPPDAAGWERVVRLGAQRTVVLGSGDDELVDWLADVADPGPGGGSSIAVVGGCGGAGASVFAAALALAGQRRWNGVLLADADPWGPGLDVVLGMEDDAGLRWSDLSAQAGRLSAEALHRVLPSVPAGRGRLSVLCHSRTEPSLVGPDVIDVVLDAGRRAGNLIVVDVPRYPLQAADRAIERADLTVVVVTADVRACFAAGRVIGRLAELGARFGLVVRGPSPGGLGADDVASALGIPLLARMRPEPGLDRRLEGGRVPGADPRGQLGRAATTVLASVADSW